MKQPYLMQSQPAFIMVTPKTALEYCSQEGLYKGSGIRGTGQLRWVLEAAVPLLSESKSRC